MGKFDLCYKCTMRNCHKSPQYIDKLHGYRCRKMRPINDRLSNILEIHLTEHDYLPLYIVLDRVQLNVVKNNKGRLLTAAKEKNNG